MNREIKFRAWDKVLKYMIQIEYGNWISFDGVCYTESDKKYNTPNIEITKVKDLILMQYTGLKDKNGKEIYEGDIVRILYTDWASQPYGDNKTLQEYKNSISKIGTVIYHINLFCIEFVYGNGSFTDSIIPGKHGEIEIIGNLFENPELINSK